MTTEAPRSADDALLREMGLATSQMLDSIDDRREAARFKRVQVAMFTGGYSGAHIGGGEETKRRGQSFIFFASLLNQVTIHTGREAAGICKTACVFPSGEDLRMHLAFNPFFLRALERVEVVRGKLPLDPDETKRLQEQGYWVWQTGGQPPYRAMANVMEEHGVVTRAYDEWVAVHLDMRYQVAVLVHEFLHLLNKHLEVDRSLYPDKASLGLAMDMVINQHIANLPPGAIHLLSYTAWGLEPPANQHFGVYYEALTKFFGDQPRGAPPDPSKPRGKQIAEGFVGSTLVALPGGQSKSIEEVRVGDEVLTFDAQNSVVPRRVWRISRRPMSTLETRKRYATKMVSIETQGGHRLVRASSRAMVFSPSKQSWVGIGDPTSVGPALEVGDSILVQTPSGAGTDVVKQIFTAPGFDDEALYQLAVLEEDSVSGYFSSGIYVKGMVAAPAPAPDAPEGPAPPPPEEKGRPDGNVIPPPGGAGPQVYHVGDEVRLRDGRLGTITGASSPNEQGVQDLEIELEEG